MSSVFYAIARGKNVGIVRTWSLCLDSTRGFPNACFKKFTTEQEALEFVDRNRDKKCEKGTELYYADGSALGNGRQGCRAGCAVYGKGRVLAAMRVPGDQTNQRAEALSVALALKCALDARDEKVCIVLDSNYARDGAAYPAIQKRNVDIWCFVSMQLIARVRAGLPPAFFAHVDGHSGNEGNEMADSAAKVVAQSRETPTFEEVQKYFTPRENSKKRTHAD